ncbi:hypothetical protein R80B4_03137 [Fibrobacteres bacterium R8-0-B4]
MSVMGIISIVKCRRALLLAAALAAAAVWSWAQDDEAEKPSDERLIKFIPAGYVFGGDEARGDLNGDGADDFIIKIIDKSWNYSGIMIFFKDGDDYKPVLDVRQAFILEGGGRSFKINRGNLYIKEDGNGTCDIHEYTYTFKYRNSEFELIGYDQYDAPCGGWTEDHSREGGETYKESVNFLSKKRMTKSDNDKEVWSKVTTKGPILLRKLLEKQNLGFDARYTEGAGTLADARDGRVYWTAKMPDGKTWMAENLNYNLPGKSRCLPVPPVCDNGVCSEYNPNDTTNCNEFGRLYFWEAAKKVCPAGFRLPSRDDWNTLVQAVGGEKSGVKLKAASGWVYDGHGINGTDDYGFSALPGESYSFNGGWTGGRIRGYWWTATEKGERHAYYRSIWYGDNNISEDASGKQFAAYSVRCVK